MKTTKLLPLSLLALSVSPLALQAKTLDIEITNLTQGIYFTPFIVAAHNADHKFFRSGEAASLSLQMMAEGGDVSALAADATSAGVAEAAMAVNPNNGLLMPGKSIASFSIDAPDEAWLSAAAMLLPTNDSFAGLDSWKIPTENGTYTVTLNAYDAGTEVNNELVVPGAGAPGALGIPADPGGTTGTGGTGVTTVEGNTMVHIHRGSLGDDNATGGKSDLDNRVHRWLNPVIKMTVTVR